jgi:hypothetical protein
MGCDINMKYNLAATDIETTGLDKATSLILEIGIVLDNSRKRVKREELEDYLLTLPTYHCYIKYPHELYGDAYALNMNKDIIRIIDEGTHPDIITIDQVAPSISKFLTKHLHKSDSWNNKIMFAGKNFAGFDRPFLDMVPGLKEILDQFFIHRVHDPAELFFDPDTMDKTPNLKECLEIAGYNTEVKHNAIDDDYDVIRCLRFHWDTSYYM